MKKSLEEKKEDCTDGLLIYLPVFFTLCCIRVIPDAI